MDARSAVDRFVRDPRTGRLTLVQRPNALITAFAAAEAARVLLRPSGAAGTALRALRTALIGAWAADELVRGDSPYRHTMGAAVLVFEGRRLRR